nr:lipase family protein [Acetobacter oeni]
MCLLAITTQVGAAPRADNSRPGTLLSSEPLPDSFSLPDAGKALRIRYLSTNGVTGKGLVPVTAEVILPPGEPPAGGWPVVAWAHGTVGLNSSCTPSLNPYTERNRLYLSAWMERGFAIVATDYQGLGTPGAHPYLDTRAEAYNVLDAVRAALASVPGLKNRVMIVGQSQGGGAAFASAAFAPEYAPDLDIRGTVATGVPYITPEIMQALLKMPDNGAGYNPVVVYTLYLGASLAGRDSGFRPEAGFTPKAMSAYRAASRLCVGPMTDKVKEDGLTFSNTLQPGYAKALGQALTDMKYPTLKLAQPLFVGTGSADRDVPPPLQLGLVKAACAAGTVVQAHIYKGLDHSQTVNASLPDSAAFTEAVMAGQPVAAQCAPQPQ